MATTQGRARFPRAGSLGQYCLVSGEVPATQGRGLQSIPTYRSFTCGDDIEIVITANTENMCRSLCSVPELSADMCGQVGRHDLVH